MVDLFNRKKEVDAIAAMFKDLRLQQRRSVMVVMLSVAFTEDRSTCLDEITSRVQAYEAALDVQCERCLKYTNQHGMQQVGEDLKTMTLEQKEFLIASVWGLITCAGTRPGLAEMSVASSLFADMGIPERQFLDVLEKLIHERRRQNAEMEATREI
ncbi:MAG: hypothetical protein EOP49_12050 [Sphingobacteriales bacterium]|nr:MAG: hypothetical protein EOP49_12050 [Sphingobacteriales bacterium]